MGFRQDQVRYVRQRLDSFDRASKTFPTLSTEHNHIHEGLGFGIAFTQLLGPQSDFYIQLITGDSYTHLKDRFYSVGGGNWLISLIEEPTSVTDGSVPIAVFNKNRNSTRLSQNTILADASNVSGGTMINEIFFNANVSFGGGAQTGLAAEEFILKPNSVYIFYVNRLDGEGNARFNTRWFWYETDE